MLFDALMPQFSPLDGGAGRMSERLTPIGQMRISTKPLRAVLLVCLVAWSLLGVFTLTFWFEAL